MCVCVCVCVCASARVCAIHCYSAPEFALQVPPHTRLTHLPLDHKGSPVALTCTAGIL